MNKKIKEKRNQNLRWRYRSFCKSLQRIRRRSRRRARRFGKSRPRHRTHDRPGLQHAIRGLVAPRGLLPARSIAASAAASGVGSSGCGGLRRGRIRLARRAAGGFRRGDYGRPRRRRRRRRGRGGGGGGDGFRFAAADDVRPRRKRHYSGSFRGNAEFLRFRLGKERIQGIRD